MRTMTWILATLALALITACATPVHAPTLASAKPITTRDLLEANPVAAGLELADPSKTDVLELSPAMIRFLDRWGDVDGEYFKLRSLLYAIMGDDTFNLVYDDKTRTAQETFDARRGNCLSFTNMFVAMSRYLGLKTKFQEVDIPPNWSAKGDTFILSQHINVKVQLAMGGDQMVDFNMYNFRTSFERHVVSDARARAHYFNNKGVEYMLQGDVAQAFANLRASIRQDKTFSSPWTNLGVLVNRSGHSNYAEAAYLQALATDSGNTVAMSNLASLYEAEGRIELAEQYRSRVKEHRRQNPFYRYQLAREAFDSGDFRTAIEHLKYAIHKNRNEDTFYFLLSLSYLNSGDREAAKRWMAKAEEVASQSRDKRRYHNKLDLLLGTGTDG